ncbi:MAG: hypothetical protein GY794_14645, partial [bacterium]|nr:hypothetical protein [bacterium]
ALIKHISDKYMASDAAAKSVNAKQWNTLVGLVGSEVSAEVKAQWIARLRSAFMSDSKTLAALNVNPGGRGWYVNYLVQALKWLGDKNTNDVRTAVTMAVLPDVSTLSVKQLIAQAHRLKATGKTGAAARVALIKHISDKYMASDAAAKSVNAKQWNTLVGLVGSEVSAEVKAQWIARLRSAFMSDNETLATLNVNPDGRGWYVNYLVQALVWLGDKNTEDVRTAVTMAVLPDPATLSVKQLIAHASRLKATGKTGAAARAALVKHISDKYMASDAAAKSVTAKQWNTLIRSLGSELSFKVRAQWIARIRSAFASEDLSFNDLSSVSAALSSLGNGNSISFVIAWTEENESWKSWELGELSRLARALRKYSQADKLKASIAALISTKYIPNTKAIQDAGIEVIARLVEALGVSFSDEDEKAWIDGIRAAFASSNEVITALGSSQCTRLVNVLTALSDPNAGSIAMVWLAGKDDDNWGDRSLEDMTAAVKLAASAGDEKGAEIMNKLAAMAMSSELDIPDKVKVCQAFSDAWSQMGKAAKAQQWAMIAYEIALGTKTARDQADMGTLKTVAIILSKAGLTGKNKGYPCFAEALASMA